jgi:rod shape-determining protein MreD
MRNKALINLIPLFSSLLFIMINSTIPPVQGYSFINPSVSIVCLIYWCLRSEKYQFNLLQVFLLGFLNDCLLGTPLGSSSLLFLLTRVFMSKLKPRLKLNTLKSEIITILLSIIFYFLISYIFIIIYFKAYSNISYYLMSFLLTLSVYPIFHIIFNRFFIYFKTEDL